MTSPRGNTRPKTRGDCIDGPRPCPWVSCRHHMIDAEREVVDNRWGKRTQRDGQIRSLLLRIADNRQATRVANKLQRMEHTCSLDVVDENPDGITLERAGELLGGICRERARQMAGAAATEALQSAEGWLD